MRLKGGPQSGMTGVLVRRGQDTGTRQHLQAKQSGLRRSQPCHAVTWDFQDRGSMQVCPAVCASLLQRLWESHTSCRQSQTWLHVRDSVGCWRCQVGVSR